MVLGCTRADRDEVVVNEARLAAGMGPPAASTITGGLRKFCRELDHVGAKINTKGLNFTKAFTVSIGRMKIVR
jgi:hypothetical protein